MKNNKTMYAILGVLSLMGPMSGYDVKKFCDKGISHFWNENFGHLYPVLAQLEKEGFIVKDNQQTDSRKKTYSITERGKGTLKDWMVEPVKYQPDRSELLLKLSFGTQMELEDTLKMLEADEQRRKEKYRQLSQIYSYYMENEEAKKLPQYPYWIVTLRYGLTKLEASLKWVDETREYLKNYFGGKEA